MFSGGGFRFGDLLGQNSQTRFVETYRCYPLSFHGKEDKENGDKIILPSSAFEKLAHMTITYPMQFELKNEDHMDISNSDSPVCPHTHVGVLEFTANEGTVYIPYWVMQNLFIPEGGLVTVTNVTLPLADFIKFQPQTKDFLDISNPKAVLESTLRNFSCMTKNDQICIPYNGKNYYLNVVDVKPKDACSIVEADVKVDFDAPLDYVEPTPPVAESTSQSNKSDTVDNRDNTLADLAKARELRVQQLENERASYVAFSGSGRRVDGKKKGETLVSAEKPPSPPVRTSKWKTRKQGTSFLGHGHSLTD